MSEKILVLGSDGYTGHHLTCSLLEEGREVVGVDNGERRGLTDSVIPIPTLAERWESLNSEFSGEYEFNLKDVTEYNDLKKILKENSPDTVVNLAQIPSAPYSMKSLEHAWHCQQNNMKGSLNLFWVLKELGLDSHVIQLATMGEYGTPDQPLPEGFLEDGRPAPKNPGSLYHASKVNTTVNTLFLSRTWDIPTTEIYQGIVYGVGDYLDKNLLTRFDVDETFGTVINRFSAQTASENPLTVYGRGGQKRAMLSLTDCTQCLKLAIENPPEKYYPYRAINQFDEAYRVRELAELFNKKYGTGISHVENPRVEDDSDHFYEPQREVLDELGYEPSRSIEEEIERTVEVLRDHRDRIPDDLKPTTEWK